MSSYGGQSFIVTHDVCILMPCFIKKTLQVVALQILVFSE